MKMLRNVFIYKGFSNQTTPCNRDRLQKLIVAKVNKEFPANYETRNFIIIVIIIIEFLTSQL